MHGREHLVGITAHKKGMTPVILRYQDELRKPEPYFDAIDTKVDDNAVKLAVDLVEQESGKFEPEKMPNETLARFTSRPGQDRAAGSCGRNRDREARSSQGRQHHGRTQEEHAGERADQKGDAVRKRMGKAAPKGQVSSA